MYLLYHGKGILSIPFFVKNLRSRRGESYFEGATASAGILGLDLMIEVFAVPFANNLSGTAAVRTLDHSLHLLYIVLDVSLPTVADGLAVDLALFDQLGNVFQTGHMPNITVVTNVTQADTILTGLLDCFVDLVLHFRNLHSDKSNTATG
jgi:hypothetical protein